MSAAREEVLMRIRRALAPQAPAPRSSDETSTGTSSGRFSAPDADDRRLDDAGTLVDRFVERVEDYRATVAVVDADGVPAAVRAICERHAVARLAVPVGVPEGWIPAGIELLAVNGADQASVRELDGVDGVLTTSLLGVAETGTIVLDGGAGQGPRAATLLPDLHICVVDATSIVPGVPELTAAMALAVDGHGRPLTMISGPSATSDIELDRVEGVHGPRRLEVLVVR